jgi:steroid delta-isomerase-like uncharacterized protein
MRDTKPANTARNIVLNPAPWPEECIQRGVDVNQEQMEQLIEAHLAAETAGDIDGCVAVYTHDVEHDMVGEPHGALHGRQEAKEFYEQLIYDIATERMLPVRSYQGEDFCVVEHEWTGRVPGSLLGVEGHGRRISFRLLHVWEFRDGLISRENVWVDGASVIRQLTAQPTPAQG